jgi:hypothetical protein
MQDVEVPQEVLDYFGFQEPEQLEAAVHAGRDAVTWDTKANERWGEIQDRETALKQREQQLENMYIADPWRAAARANASRAMHGLPPARIPRDIVEQFATAGDIQPQQQQSQGEFEAIFGQQEPAQPRPQLQPPSPGNGNLTPEAVRQVIKSELDERQDQMNKRDLETSRTQMAGHAVSAAITRNPALAQSGLDQYLLMAVNQDIQTHSDRNTAPKVSETTPERYYQWVSGLVAKHAARLLHGVSAQTQTAVAGQQAVQGQFPASPPPPGGLTPTPTMPAHMRKDEGLQSVNEFTADSMQRVNAAFGSQQGRLPAY